MNTVNSKKSASQKTSSTNTSTSDYVIDDKIYYQIHKILFLVIDSLISQGPLNKGAIVINYNALDTAFKEIQKDVQFMYKRRTYYPSRSKVAGCIVFRLHRHSVVVWHKDVHRLGTTTHTAIIPVIAVMCWLYHDVDRKLEAVKKHINELYYMLSHRHINQEAIAITLNSISQISCLTKKNIELEAKLKVKNAATKQ